MIEEDEFAFILAVAERLLDVYGRRENPDSPRLTYTEGELSIGSEGGIIDIFCGGSLVFRHAPNGEITDFFERNGAWIDRLERIARDVPQSSSGITRQRR